MYDRLAAVGLARSGWATRSFVLRCVLSLSHRSTLCSFTAPVARQIKTSELCIWHRHMANVQRHTVIRRAIGAAQLVHVTVSCYIVNRPHLIHADSLRYSSILQLITRLASRLPKILPETTSTSSITRRRASVIAGLILSRIADRSHNIAALLSRSSSKAFPLV